MKLHPWFALSVLALACTFPLASSAGDNEAQAVAQTAGSTGPHCPNPAQLTRLQQRLVDEAANGPVPLRRYIYRTRQIHELDYTETVEWLDRLRRDTPECVALLSSAQRMRQ